MIGDKIIKPESKKAPMVNDTKAMMIFPPKFYTSD